jgi:hypothetical protein
MLVIRHLFYLDVLPRLNGFFDGDSVVGPVKLDHPQLRQSSRGIGIVSGSNFLWRVTLGREGLGPPYRRSPPSVYFGRINKVGAMFNSNAQRLNLSCVFRRP